MSAEKRSRMSFLDEATQKLSNGVHTTFKETCQYGFDEISKVVYYAIALRDKHERLQSQTERERKLYEALESIMIGKGDSETWEEFNEKWEKALQTLNECKPNK